MFDSVLDRGVAPRRRLATGAVISVFGHAAVLTLALLVRPPAVVEEVTKTFPTVIIPAFKPAPAPALKGGGGAPAHPGPARASRPRRELLAPAALPDKIDLETFAPPDETAVVGERIGPDTSRGAPGVPDGVPDGTCVGGPCPFNELGGMTRPKLIERGRDPDYTPEALEAHVQGLMTVECVVTLEGRLEQCQALRPLPYMERAVVEALMTRRYSPATLNGRPLAVRYVFHVKLVMPQ